ncbi:MAG: PAS domain-containing protein [Acidobacteria bacterium]|nr:PAS domain-containing protein [Acidobacteriota bacterium]
MQNAFKLETALLDSDFNLAPRFGYHMRLIVPAALYLGLYAALLWGVRALGVSAFTGEFGLHAGLNVGLLLSCGLGYAPVVAAAAFVHSFWFHDPAYSGAWALGIGAAVVLVEIGAAALLLRFLSGHRATLRRGRDLAFFLGVSAGGAVLCAAAAILPGALEAPGDWSRLLGEFAPPLVGYACGLLLLTPLLVIHLGPRLQAALFGVRDERAGFLRPLRMDRRSTFFALAFLCLAGAALWFVFTRPAPDRLYAFILLSAPLVWVAVRRGLEGTSIAAPLIGGAFALLLATVDAAPAAGWGWLAIVCAASVNAHAIAVGITRTRSIEGEMERRNAILDAVSHAARQFLGNTGWETGARDVIRRLGEATAVTRVYLMDSRTPELGGQVGDACRYEWESSALAKEEGDRKVLDLIRSQMIDEMSDRFYGGHPVVFHARDVDRKKREILEAMGIRSGVIVPMFVDGQLWGCIGLEQCFVDREWPLSEIDGLKMAGQILGTIIASVRVEQQFRQLTGNIQAVFWISAPDGRAKQYVSPGYEEVWGRTCASLQRNPSSWIQAIHPEDRGRISEALIRQGWNEYDEEYRVERPDGSIRWIHDRAFPVRDQAGKVERVVGIAEDVTRQKKTEESLRAATVLLSSLIDHLHSGVVVEDEERRITHVNQSFTDMFRVPVQRGSLLGIDSRLLFAQTAEFAERIESVIRDAEPVLGEEIAWQERAFLRNYVPLSIDAGNRYHLWQYQDVTASRRAEEQIKASLQEKEVLLKEIHHRVKNNLQIISSLLNLQSAEIEDPQANQKFKESQDRVKAMALIHERLYQSSDLARIDFSGYVRSLTGHLVRSYRVNASAIRLNLEVESVPMSLDVAIPCGLVINELVSNAFKYAFPEGKNGCIDVRFYAGSDGGLHLSVRDDGVGCAPDWNPDRCDSLGLKLVRSLTEQLGGTIEFRSRSGFACAIVIPHART